MFFEIGPDGEIIGVKEIDPNHVMVVQDQFGTIRYLNESGTLLVIRPGEPIGYVRAATPEEITRIEAQTPITSYVPPEDTEGAKEGEGEDEGAKGGEDEGKGPGDEDTGQEAGKEDQVTGQILSS